MMTIASTSMASSASCSFYYFTPRSSRKLHRRPPFVKSSVSIKPGGEIRDEEIVIVGAGIAGLATALSLKRLGIRTVVLEQGSSLRTGGTSLTLFKNGWRVLDTIGVADELRSKYLQIQGLVMRSDDGLELRSFSFEEEAPGQEVRAVERGVLLETLASKLPPEAICFSSKLKHIKKLDSGGTALTFEDGTWITAKVVIGCEGVRSPVAKWMGFSEPKYVGHCAFRGLGLYSEGQPFKSRVNYIYGRGLRAGFVPVSSSKVYWFICFNSSAPGIRTKDASALKKEALDLIKSWPDEILDVIERTPDYNVIKTPLVDRWLWPGLSPPASAKGVVVAGDAWHPMTPNLGQGGCCALEDAVVLASKLGSALRVGRQELVDEALRDYSQERWARVFPLTVRANLVGSLLQWDNPLVCTVRDNIMIPKLVRLGPFLEHTNLECTLPEPVAS